MKKIPFFKCVLIGSLFSLSLCHAGELALVLGYQNQTQNQLWQDKQIGFGVKNMLSQRLLDNSVFSLLDEKVISGLDNPNIETKLQTDWMLDDAKIAPNYLEKMATQYQVRHIFWVKITEFETRTSKMSIGFLNSANYEDTLKLAVCHYKTATKETQCQDGEASESRTLNGVLYSPAEKLNFNESGAGKLTQEAINQSLNTLLSHE